MPRILPFEGVRPKIADDVFVAPGAIIIGDVEIGAGSSVWYGCVLRGDVNLIRIGAGSNIQDATVIHVTRRNHGTFIGDGVLVGHACLIHGCTLEDGAFIGMRATVMDGVVVEGGAMVAAGVLVTPRKRVAKGTLWGGSPAQYMRDLTDEEAANIPAAATRYADLAQRHRKGG